jgi:hypothetical protein
MTTEQIAKIAHELNKSYCEALSDYSQPNWGNAPDWQRESAIKGVQFRLANPHASASAQHEAWLEEKTRDGWKHGLVKDPLNKEHPCFLPFDQLPLDQQAKDALFAGVVSALKPLLDDQQSL